MRSSDLGSRVSELRSDTAATLLERVREVAGADPGATGLARLLIAPLEREDAQRGNNLVATLRVYYACDARVDRTADALFLHRNSVRYRLDRIRSLVGLDIDRPNVMAALLLALDCRQPSERQVGDAG